MVTIEEYIAAKKLEKPDAEDDDFTDLFFEADQDQDDALFFEEF